MKPYKRQMAEYPIAWLKISTGSETVPSSNYWTTNTTQTITVKSARVAWRSDHE